MPPRPNDFEAMQQLEAGHPACTRSGQPCRPCARKQSASSTVIDPARIAQVALSYAELRHLQNREQE